MNCVPLNECGGCSSSEKKSDVDRWTTHVTKVLTSPSARRKFHSFLQKMDMEEAEATLCFWEQIDVIQKKKSNDDLTRNELLRRYQKLYKHANEFVNLDEAEMKCLKRLTSSSNQEEENDILERAKQSAQNLLLEDHRQFSTHLWRQLGR